MTSLYSHTAHHLPASFMSLIDGGSRPGHHSAAQVTCPTSHSSHTVDYSCYGYVVPSAAPLAQREFVAPPQFSGPLCAVLIGLEFARNAEVARQSTDLDVQQNATESGSDEESDSSSEEDESEEGNSSNASSVSESRAPKLPAPELLATARAKMQDLVLSRPTGKYPAYPAEPGSPQLPPLDIVNDGELNPALSARVVKLKRSPLSRLLDEPNVNPRPRWREHFTFTDYDKECLVNKAVRGNRAAVKAAAEEAKAEAAKAEAEAQFLLDCVANEDGATSNKRQRDDEDDDEESAPKRHRSTTADIPVFEDAPVVQEQPTEFSESMVAEWLLELSQPSPSQLALEQSLDKFALAWWIRNGGSDVLPFTIHPIAIYTEECSADPLEFMNRYAPIA